MKSDYDICVIGAGPGGYVAAIRAGQLGAKVAIVEKDFPGGTCLNCGCIPTKTFIASAEALKIIRNASEFGVVVEGEARADWKSMLSRKNEVVGKLRLGILSLLKAGKIDFIEGVAKFADRKKIVVAQKNGKEIVVSAEKIIVASGSEPAAPSFIPKDKRILTSTELLDIESIPKSLLALGGGVIGCEFACMFSALGTEVTVIEMLPQILPAVDLELSNYLTKEMAKGGIKVITGTKVEKVSLKNNKVVCQTGDDEFSAEYMLVAVGRKPVVSGLNLEKAGVRVDEKGFVRVDSKCRTNAPGVYAIGDVTGRIQLAHLASAMGTCAAENACGKNCEFRDDLVPNCIFTSPEIGAVGLSEQDCENRKIKYKVGKFPFAALGKALAINETSGFCKVIADAETDQALGVHIIGPHATDLIAEAATAMNLEITAESLGKAIHAHPTLAEAVMEAAHDVHGRCVHAPPRRKK
jgi:dihydrolipoamide dehydrogenase